MNTEQTTTSRASDPRRHPRLWPACIILGVLFVALLLSVTPQIHNFIRFLFLVLGPFACAGLFLLWLLLASRLRLGERAILAVGTAVLGIAVVPLVHASVPPLLVVYGAPLAMLLITIGLWIGRRWQPAARSVLALGLVAAGWSSFNLVRLAGFDGSYRPTLHWRWHASAEERLRAAGGEAIDSTTTGDATVPLELEPGDWPGFRGPHRDSRVDGVTIDLDWDGSPPRERWRVPVGPAWSSFAHVAGRLFTQEQRGEQEAVVSLDADSGAEVWRYQYDARFSDIVAGAGPRATPTFARGRVYSLGARAMLTCLDAATGELVWSRDLVRELGATQPEWGFSGSPLLVDDLAVVYVGGDGDRGLVAFDATTGEERWHAGGRGSNFSSAQLVTIDGTELILFTDTTGLLAIDPSNGHVVWRFMPGGWKEAPMVQPQLIGERDILVALGDGVGVARLEVRRAEGIWITTERWSTRRLKAAFNDFVYHDGAIFGFDKSIFACVDAETGASHWRRGRYGFGQVILLVNSDALIVISESGDLILIATDTTEPRELATFSALPGKTWNHPVVVGDRLFVRNGEEAVCFELPVVGGSE